MNQIALYLGERAVYWSSIVIALGALCALSLTIALFRPRSESLRPVLTFFPLAVILQHRDLRLLRRRLLQL